MKRTGRNTYRDGFEAKPCGIGSKTSGFALKPIRFALPPCGLELFPHGFGPEIRRIDVTANIFGSLPCGNESLPHRNDLQQVLWNQWMQRCAILRHDIESLSHDIGSLSHDIGSLSHDNQPFPHGFDSFPYRFNGATISFRPSTIAFGLKTSDLKALRYCSAPDSCALARVIVYNNPKRWLSEEFPSSAEEGWLRGSRKSCEAT